MTLAALIILADERPTMPVLGLSWPEFQLRRAVCAGALHLVLVTDRVARDVVEAVDRLRSEGLSTTLARSNAEVADLFHPDEAVLLLTGSHVVNDARLAGLLAAPKPTLLCIDSDRAGPDHELIDAKGHWTGIARIDGAQIRATVSVAGDWDLGSTLLRKAVSARAARLMSSADEIMIDASSAAGAAQASRTLAANVSQRPRGWGARWIVAPFALLIAQTFPAVLPLLARLGPWVALALFALAPVIQIWRWTPAALAVFLLALTVATSAKLAAAATGIPQRSGKLVRHFQDAAGLALLFQIVTISFAYAMPLVLGIGIVAFAAMSAQLWGLEIGVTGSWLADIAGHAIILLTGSIFGDVGLLVGLILCTLHGLATLAFLQNRLSRSLTSPR